MKVYSYLMLLFLCFAVPVWGADQGAIPDDVAQEVHLRGEGIGIRLTRPSALQQREQLLNHLIQVGQTTNQERQSAALERETAATIRHSQFKRNAWRGLAAVGLGGLACLAGRGLAYSAQTNTSVTNICAGVTTVVGCNLASSLLANIKNSNPESLTILQVNGLAFLGGCLGMGLAAHAFPVSPKNI